MRSLLLAAFISGWGASRLPAQLTTEQKLLDFEHLASQFAKNYGPYEWKRDFAGFDLFQLGPWMDRVRATRDDLEFYELMKAYTVAFDDAHVSYSVPSNFEARLHFTTDIYDGRVLVDSINRARLPVTEFPFRTGYEVVSVDGKTAEEWIREFSRYQTAANPRSTRRVAAGLIPIRRQSLYPRAHEVGEVATVVLRRFDGGLETYRIPWAKSGLPLRVVGPAPLPGAQSKAVERALIAEKPEYLRFLERLQRVEVAPRAVLGFGARTPIFEMPNEFQQRLGRAAADFFFSGTFQAGGQRIGFIRIPSFSPPNLNVALNQFVSEMLYMQANTDGLILDIMRNPGGRVDFTNELLQLAIPREFRTVGFEVRATSSWIVDISSSVDSARAQGAPPFFIGQLEFLKEQFISANRQPRGRTLAIPLDDITLDREPFRDARGNALGYFKPLMLLTDEMTASGGDVFAATIQDSGRGVLFGMRTMGAGGNVASYPAGVFSEGSTTVTESLMIRAKTVQPPGYPASPYIENVGVHPDIEEDYMTQDNLVLNGRIFVNRFVQAMVEHIRRNR